MRGETAGMQRWRAALLRAARAAAFLVLTTGINGTLDTLWPGYEPFYLYLVTVMVMAWLGSAWIGVAGAIAAVVIYNSMFTAAGMSVINTWGPLSIAVTTAVVAHLVRRPIVTRLQSIRPAAPPLLPAAREPVVMATPMPAEAIPVAPPPPAFDRTLVDRLERNLEEARATASRESRLRSEMATAAMLQQEQLQRTVEALRAEKDQLRQQAQSAGAEMLKARGDAEKAAAQVERLRQQSQSAAGAIDQSQRELQLARTEAAERVLELTEVRAQLHRAEEALREATARSENAQDDRQRALAETTSRYEAGLANARKRLDESAADIATLRKELEAARKGAADEKARADREAMLRSQLETAARETLQRTADVSASHQRSAAESQQRVHLAEQEKGRLQDELMRLQERLQEATRASVEMQNERERTIADALRQLEEGQQEIFDLQGRLAESQHSADEALAQIAALQLEVAESRRTAEQQRLRAEEGAQRQAVLTEQFDRKLQDIVHGITTDYEAALGDATVEREAARAEVRRLKKEFESLQQRMALAERAFTELQALREREAIYQTKLDEAVTRERHGAERAASLERELEAARIEVVSLQSRQQLLTEEIAGLRLAVTELEANDRKLASATDTVTYLESQMTAAQNDLQDSRRELEETRQIAQTSMERAQVIELELAQLRDQLAATRQHAAELESMHSMEESRAAERERRLVTAEQSAERLRNHLLTAEEHLQSARERIAELESARQEDGRERTERQRHLVALEASAGELRRQLDEAEDELEQAAEMASQRERKEQALQEELQALRSEVALRTDRLSEMEVIIADQRLQWEEAARATEEERGLREKQRAEFDERLQTIVTGIAEDHENALGEALMEKEEARAEVRTLTTRVQELQKRLGDLDKIRSEVDRKMTELRQTAENERRRADEQRQQIDAEWSEKLQRIVTNLASDHESDVGQALMEKEEAKAETRRLSARVTTLHQQLEQERERFRLATERWNEERFVLAGHQTASGLVPLPRPSRAEPLVLMVLSDPDQRLAAKESLEQSGYAVVTAGDGLEAMRMASAKKPDVVVAETILPKMNGRELVRLLKSRPETAEMKIILLSAGSDSGEDRGSEFRADDMLHNKGDLSALRQTLDQVLGRPA